LLTRAVLAFVQLLSRTSSNMFFEDERAVPVHPLFERIKIHISQILRFYGNSADELIQKFINKLIPTNPNPLRFIVLSSMSLFTTRVYLHPKNMQPDPVQAYIDGFFNLVIDLKENVIRIPLIPKKSRNGQSPTSATLPPSLRFKGINESDEQRMREFIFDEAPKNGRKMQLHAFLSVINAAKPVMDYVSSLRSALTSIDLSFSIAICLLCTNPDNFGIIQSMLNVFMCDKKIDFFIRALSVATLSSIQNSAVTDCMELIALSNIFVATSFKFTRRIKPRGGITAIIESMCNGMNQRGLSEIAMYMLKIALVVAAYNDKSGLDVIAMLLEITVRPFASVYSLTEQFDELKRSIMQKEGSSANIRGMIEKSIMNFLTDDVSVVLKPDGISIGIQDIHDFILAHIDDFINLVIFLNDRSKSLHPTVQMFKFAYEMCVKHAIV
jgi:hypothetical protein